MPELGAGEQGVLDGGRVRRRDVQVGLVEEVLPLGGVVIRGRRRSCRLRSRRSGKDVLIELVVVGVPRPVPEHDAPREPVIHGRVHRR